MKNIFIPVFYLTAIMMISGIIIFQSDTMVHTNLIIISEIIHVVTIISLLITGLYFGRKRIKLEREGLASDDELSQLILYKSGYFTLYFSMILWIILIYIIIHSTIIPKLLFSYGFIGTVFIFIIIYSIFNKIGLKNE